MARQTIKGTWQEDFSFSPAVVTQGGRIIWLAGHTGQVDDDGKSLAGDIEAQTRQTFRNLERSLAAAGGKLEHIVTMTVFLRDARHTRSATEVRKQIFKRDFPASAAITVAGFADPNMLIEIQAIAVMADACSSLGSAVSKGRDPLSERGLRRGQENSVPVRLGYLDGRDDRRSASG